MLSSFFINDSSIKRVASDSDFQGHTFNLSVIYSGRVKLELPPTCPFYFFLIWPGSTFGMCSKSYDSSQLVGEKSSKIQKHDNMFKFNITELIKCELYILVLCHSQWKFCIYHVLHKNSNIWFIGHIMVQVTYINLYKNTNKNIFEDTILYFISSFTSV